MTGFIRPEVRRMAWRWREVAVGVAVGVLGLWWALTSFGILRWVGVALCVIAAALTVVAIQRLRFDRGGGGAGVVQLNERRVGYFGPETGGVVDLDDLVRLELIGGRVWRLTGGPEVLEIPVDAKGAEALFDLFAALPGMRTAAMIQTLNAAPAGVVTVWQAAGEPGFMRLS